MRTRDAVRRGAATGVLCASIALALLACVAERLPAGTPSTSIITVFPAMQAYMMEEGPVGPVAASIAASAVLGAAMGAFAKRVRGSPGRRAAVTILAGVPVLWFVITISITTAVLPGLMAHVSLADVLWPLLVVPFWAAVGLVLGAPWLAPTLIAAALLLEGWTRPESLRQTGLARPRLRTIVLLALAVVAAVLTTFAVLHPRGTAGGNAPIESNSARSLTRGRTVAARQVPGSTRTGLAAR